MHVQSDDPTLFRKDIELLRCDFRLRGFSLRSSKTLLPFPEMQSSRIVPLASAPAGYAVPYSTTRDHCNQINFLSTRRKP